MEEPVQPVLLRMINAVNRLVVILYSNVCIDSISLTIYIDQSFTGFWSSVGLLLTNSFPLEAVAICTLRIVVTD